MQVDRANAVVRTLREPRAQSVMAAAWSPQGTPLVSADKAGAITFWAPGAEVSPSQTQQLQPASPGHQHPHAAQQQQHQHHRGSGSSHHSQHTR